MAASTTPAGAYTGPLTFAWPTGCSLPVIEHVDKNGTTATLSYSLSIMPEGELSILSFGPVVIEAMNGAPITQDQADAVAPMFQLPSFVVDRSGAIVEVRGVDALIDQMESLGLTEGVAQDGLAGVIEDSVTSKYWGTWVGLWAAWGPIQATPEERTGEVSAAGVTVPTNVRVESLSPTRAGLATLRATQTITGVEADEIVDNVVSSIASGPQPTAPGMTFDRTTVIQIETDPSTLRMANASLTVDAQATSGGSKTSSEHRQWTFDWPASGCT